MRRGVSPEPQFNMGVRGTDSIEKMDSRGGGSVRMLIGMKVPRVSRPIYPLAFASATLLWMAQPPLGWWPLAFIALVPWVLAAATPSALGYRDYGGIWLAGFVFWSVTLQGLRHAHPWMFLPWLALAGYLAIYPPLFVAATRRLVSLKVPWWVAVPVAWVGWEWVRNHALTGISAAMLGHALADVPALIQIADLFGSYGVSFVVASVNAAAALVIAGRGGRFSPPPVAGPRAQATAVAVAAGLVAAAWWYGRAELRSEPGPVIGRVALIQRDERTEYLQDRERDQEIFANYARQTLVALRETERPVDAVVWPESMLSGGHPWAELGEVVAVPSGEPFDESTLRHWVSGHQQSYLRRAGDMMAAMAGENGGMIPHWIGGCGVIRYGEQVESYSGLLHLPPDGAAPDWYGKTHLVMFGEYIPLVGAIPGLRSLVPPGMGLQVGQGPRVFSAATMRLAGNICIETAVERVTVNQMRGLRESDGVPVDAIVTVTNDAWFNGTSVVAHHLRSAQFVAVGCRRPLLSAANGGPTAWIDHQGRVVRRLGFREHGWVIATPRREERLSLYVRIGDLPAALLGWAVVAVTLQGWWSRRRRKSPPPAASPDSAS